MNMNPILQKKLEQHQLLLSDSNTGAPCDHRGDDLTGSDFTIYNISQANLAWNNLTDCIMPVNCQNVNFSGCYGTNVDFSKSNITDATFENAVTDGFNMVGALYNNKIVNMTFDTSIKDKPFWCGINNVFIQIGCQIKTYAKFVAMSDDDRRLAVSSSSKMDPETAVLWWNTNQIQIGILAKKYSN